MTTARKKYKPPLESWRYRDKNLQGVHYHHGIVGRGSIVLAMKIGQPQTDYFPQQVRQQLLLFYFVWMKRWHIASANVSFWSLMLPLIYLAPKKIRRVNKQKKGYKKGKKKKLKITREQTNILWGYIRECPTPFEINPISWMSHIFARAIVTHTQIYHCWHICCYWWSGRCAIHHVY